VSKGCAKLTVRVPSDEVVLNRLQVHHHAMSFTWEQLMDAQSYASFFREFMDESDRAAIVLGAAQMDDLLITILTTRLIDAKKDWFDFNGPFGTFSAKIDTAHAVGVIDKSFASKINLVRKIRNECAHNIQSVDLDANPVSQRIAELVASFEDTTFWAINLQEAGDIFKKSGNTLTLRLAMALLVVNLVMISRTVKAIDRTSAQAVFSPRGET